MVLDAAADDMRGSGTTVTGLTSSVERFIADRPTLSRRTLRLDRLTLQQLAIYAAGNHDRLDLTERETAR